MRSFSRNEVREDSEVEAMGLVATLGLVGGGCERTCVSVLAGSTVERVKRADQRAGESSERQRGVGACELCLDVEESIQAGMPRARTRIKKGQGTGKTRHGLRRGSRAFASPFSCAAAGVHSLRAISLCITACIDREARLLGSAAEPARGRCRSNCPRRPRGHDVAFRTAPATIN